MDEELIKMQKLSQILNMKSYCGTKNDLPPGYDQFGTRYECLRKGVGVGLHKKRVLSQKQIISIATVLDINTGLYSSRKMLLKKILSITLVRHKK